MSESGDCCVATGSAPQNIDDKVAESIDGKHDMAANVGEAGSQPEIVNSDGNSRSATPDVHTPPDYASSGSPSPIPEDGSEVNPRKIDLGKDISLMMRALNSLRSPEEKIAALCKKYADLLEQQKAKVKKERALEQKAAQYAKQNDKLGKELDKALIGKAKMESLARELNKQNKMMKEETYNLNVSHNKERERVSAKFQAATDEISEKINAIAERNDLLNQQNREMSDKITKLVEETVSREEMFKKMMEQRDIQEKILELKAKKADEERDLVLTAKEILEKEVEKTTELCEGYKKQEMDLRAQIAFYSEKVSDFQSTLDKSNKVFTKFRGEMDSMNAKMKSLEKASATWKKNYEKCEAENKRLVAEAMKQAAQHNQLNIKVTRLTNLSRALQAERNDLAEKVKMAQNANNIQSTVNELESQAVPRPLQTVADNSDTAQPAPQVRGQPQGQESPDSSEATIPAETRPNDAPTSQGIVTSSSDETEGDHDNTVREQTSSVEADSTTDGLAPIIPCNVTSQ